MTAKPDSAACLEAGKRLLAELSDKNVNVAALAVGRSSDGQANAIYVYLRTTRNKAAVPTTFEDFEVITNVLGRIRPL